MQQKKEKLTAAEDRQYVPLNDILAVVEERKKVYKFQAKFVKHLYKMEFFALFSILHAISLLTDCIVEVHWL